MYDWVWQVWQVWLGPNATVRVKSNENMKCKTKCKKKKDFGILIYWVKIFESIQDKSIKHKSTVKKAYILMSSK